jgi:hypothetical protein
MGHIQDRWYATVKGPAGGKAIRVKTALFGKGLRYKVRYLDPDRSEKSKMYPDRCKKQAEDFLLEVESNKREGYPRAGGSGFGSRPRIGPKGNRPMEQPGRFCEAD